MISIHFKNEEIILEKSCSIAELIAMQKCEGNFAIALNRTFISRSQHANTFIHNADVIELIVPMQGG